MEDPPTASPAERRAAEERVFERYKAQMFRTMVVPPERRDNYTPIWPLADGRIRGSEAFQGIFVEEMRLERSHPDTVMVIVFRHFLRPECRFASEWAIWHLGDMLEPEPHYNDVFSVNFGEWIAVDFKPRRYECQQDETILAGAATPWTQVLPRIASGELDFGPKDRALAVRALSGLSLGA